MDARRRIAAALLGVFASSFSTAPARSQDGPRAPAPADAAAAVHSDLVQEKLRAARDPSMVSACLDATRWLFEHEPAFSWLAANAGLPADYDWRLLTREQEELGPRAARRRTLPADHPAIVRDRWLETWAATIKSELTADDARQALIALVTGERHDDDQLVRPLPELGNAEERREEDFVVLGGGWRCHLELRTFTVSFGGRRLFRAISGVFERDDASGWWARVTEESTAHGR